MLLIIISTGSELIIHSVVSIMHFTCLSPSVSLSVVKCNQLFQLHCIICIKLFKVTAPRFIGLFPSLFPSKEQTVIKLSFTSVLDQITV